MTRDLRIAVATAVIGIAVLGYVLVGRSSERVAADGSTTPLPAQASSRAISDLDRPGGSPSRTSQGAEVRSRSEPPPAASTRPSLPASAGSGFDIDRPETWGPPPAEVHGRLTRATDGAPVTDASVELSKANAPSDRSTTGLDGTFRFSGVAPGEYRLRARAPGSGTDLRSLGRKHDRDSAGLAPGSIDVRVTEGQITRADLALEIGGTVLVKVFDSSGAPAPDQFVHVSPASFDAAAFPSSGRTDAGGACRIVGVPPGRFTAMAGGVTETAQHMQSEPFDVAAGAETEVVIREPARVTFRIRCVGPNGALDPVALLWVKDEQGRRVAASRIDGTGYAEVLVPRGKLTVEARAGSLHGKGVVEVGETAPTDFVLELEAGPPRAR